MTTMDVRTRTTGNITNTLGVSDATSGRRIMSTRQGRELFTDGMDRRVGASQVTAQATRTSLLGDVASGVLGGIGALVGGVVDAIGDGLGALARGDILGAVANIPRAFINTFLGGIGLFTEIGVGLFTTAVDAVLGLLRR